ncbi:flagellar FliL protein [Deferribacter desulfuricans SSM1]|uniref:Flagellar protein FliL n=1 Tax=Deferribacter desulfuricans (strain DSM 14783 / JCM 11476 / NBRC 101012 / SSM1) TaxID=639282 RepID=D3P8Y2_DEFDS|nr:flagellar basal body-associated FliL family protein [Deferribacter desulfuricans]BAI81172.1 flagellar FliL protein [Deferribacter desulfuricans SSM1]
MADEEKKEQEQEEEGGKKKKKSKLLLIIIILVVLLIVGGGAAYFFVLKPKADNKAEAAAAKKKEVKAEPAIGPLYSLDTFIVNLADPGGTRYLKVTMQLELDSEKVQEEMEKRKPQIRDVILTVLSSKTYAEVSTAQGKLALKQELIRRINLILTTGSVKNIYFTEFVAQ